MNETELERLIVRLTLDANGYQKSAEEAIAKTTKISDSLTSLSSNVQGFERGLVNLGGSLVSALGASASAGWLQANFEKFQQMEVSQIRMRAAIEANGRAASSAMGQYTDFANQIDEATGINRGQTLSLIQMSERIGVVGEDAQRLTQNAIALAASMGSDNYQAFIRVAQAMETGNTALVRRALQLRNVRSDAEVMDRANRMLNQGWEVQQRIANSASGVMNKFGDAIKAVKYQFGEIIANAFIPVIRYLTGVIEKFKGLDDATKKIIVGAALITTAFLAIGPAVMAFQTAFGPLVSSFSTLGPILKIASLAVTALASPFAYLSAAMAGVVFLISPIGLAIMGAIASLKLMADSLGGWGALWQKFSSGAVSVFSTIKTYAVMAWNFISEKLSEFIAWSRPIWMQYVNVAITVWELISSMAQVAWGAITTGFGHVRNFIFSIFRAISGQTLVDWGAIRDFITESLIRVEFVLRNFDSIASLVWDSILLAFVRTWNQIHHIFTVVMPAILTWFGDNWRDIFTTIGNFAMTTMSNLASNVGTTFRRLPEIIRGEVSFADIWTPLTDGFVNTIRELPNISEREVGVLERQLMNSVENQGRALNESYNRLRDQRLRELGINPTDQRALENESNRSGMRIGEAFNQGYKKEAEKLEVALLRSAEGLARIKAYMDRVKNPEGQNRQNQSSGGGSTRPNNGYNFTPNPNEIVGPVQPFSPQTQQNITAVARAVPRELTNLANQGSFNAVGSVLNNLTGSITQLNSYLSGLGNNQLAVVDTNNFTGIQ